MTRGEDTPKTLTFTQKKMFLKKICNGEYTEEDLIFIRVVEDFSSGFAFTKDAFCYGGDLREEISGDGKILYSEINSLEFSRTKEKESSSLSVNDVSIISWMVRCHCNSEILNDRLLWQIGTFLEFAKD